MRHSLNNEPKYDKGSPVEVYLLGIDSDMVRVEKIISKYYDTAQYADKAWYVRGRRDPLAARSEVGDSIDKSLVSNYPWHPYLCIPILKDMVEYFQYDHMTVPEHFATNPVQDSDYRYHVSISTNDTDIVRGYVPDISDSDMHEVLSIMLGVYTRELKSIFQQHPDAIYTMDTTTNLYRLIKHADIRIYRFNEITEGCSDA